MRRWIDPLIVNDEFGDSLTFSDLGSDIKLVAINYDHEVPVALTPEAADQIIAWLATWKENQES